MMLGEEVRTMFVPTRSELAPLFVPGWPKLACGDLCSSGPLPEAVASELAFAEHRIVMCGPQVGGGGHA